MSTPNLPWLERGDAMIPAIVFSSASLILLFCILRQRHRNALNEEYCRGVKDGIALGRASIVFGRQPEGIRVVMSMN